MTTYHNPILSGMYPDPSICRVGEDYYLVTSSFCYFPGVPLFHSRDLIHWRQIGHCLSRPSQLNLGDIASAHGIFAPTIRHHNGRFYMITTLVGGAGHFYVWTDDPAGDWSDPIWINAEGIDPSLFFDTDGRVYLTCTGDPHGIYLAELDLATGRILSEQKMIWGGTGGRYPEGPHIYHHNGYYYLLISEGGTEYAHRITLARAKHIWDDYEPCPHNPIFSHQNYPDHPLQATGHGDLVQDTTGKWWMVCLAIRPTSQYFQTHHLGRETILTPVTWDKDGWLTVNDGKLVGLEMTADTPPSHTWDELPPRDDFDSPTLAPVWNFIRTPRQHAWSLIGNVGHLRLYGDSNTLDTRHPTFIGRRQRYQACSVEALLQCDTIQHGHEAGVTIYQNEQHHYEVGLLIEANQRWLFVRQRIGELNAVVARIAWQSTRVHLMILATSSHYQCGYKDENGIFHPIAIAQTRYLSSEVAGGFTGVYFGMYVAGATHADFDWFECRQNDDD